MHHSILSTLSDAVAVFALKSGQLQYTNATFERWFGVHATLSTAFPDLDLARMRLRLERRGLWRFSLPAHANLPLGAGVEFELRTLPDEGVVLAHARSLGGAEMARSAASTQITDLERRLRRSEKKLARLQSITETMPQIWFLADRTLKARAPATDSARDFLGTGWEGTRLDNFLEFADSHWREQLQQTLTTGVPVDLKIQRCGADKVLSAGPLENVAGKRDRLWLRVLTRAS